MISGTTVITMPTTIFFVSSQTSLDVIIFEVSSSGSWLVFALLKREFRRQLNLSRDSLESCGGSCRSDRSVGRAGGDIGHKRRAGCGGTRSNSRGIIELWSIEEIEELCP